MVIFCKYCNNLLSVNTIDDTLKFECNSCHTKYDATDEDSLRYEDTRGGNIMIFNKILQTASKDPINPKVYKKCPKCRYELAKQVRLGDEMKLINTCLKCNHQWI